MRDGHVPPAKGRLKVGKCRTQATSAVKTNIFEIVSVSRGWKKRDEAASWQGNAAIARSAASCWELMSWANPGIPGAPISKGKRDAGSTKLRPPSCRNFICLWLLDDRFDDKWKPNKCKMMLVAETPDHIVVYVDKGANQPWSKEPYLSTLREIARRGYDVGGIVTVAEKWANHRHPSRPECESWCGAARCRHFSGKAVRPEAP